MRSKNIATAIAIGIVIAAVFASYNLINKYAESYQNIDKVSENTEMKLDQYDKSLYEYNQYKYGKILQNDGNLLNRIVVINDYSHNPYKQKEFAQNNQEYIPNEYSAATDLTDIVHFNDNVDIPINNKLFSFSRTTKPSGTATETGTEAPMIPNESSAVNQVLGTIIDKDVQYTPVTYFGSIVRRDVN